MLGQVGEEEHRFEVEFSGVGNFNGSSVVFAKPTNNLHRLQFIHDKGPIQKYYIKNTLLLSVIRIKSET